MAKNPKTAVLLSVIYPGIGIIYAGKKLLGIIVTLITTYLTILIIFPLIFFEATPRLDEMTVIGWTGIIIYWIIVVLASYKSAKLSNLEEKGGKVGIVDQDSIICPECLHNNTKGTERCVNCGKNLKLVLLYSGEFLFHDVEITHTKIIEYHKNFRGKRNGKITEYLIKNIQNYDINKDIYNNILFPSDPVMFLFGSLASKYSALSFEYKFPNGYIGRKEVIINKEKINDLKKVLELKKIPYQDSFQDRFLF